jgi:hypothetical protein
MEGMMYANKNQPMPILFAISVFLLVSPACGSSTAIPPESTFIGVQGQVSNTPIPSNTPGPSNTLRPPDTPRPTNTPKPSNTPTLAPQPIFLKGSGDSVVDVPKWDDPAILDIIYTGAHNFIVENYSSNGDQIDLLVNTIGSYHGRRPIDFRSDEYTTRLSIKASGQWEIQVLPLDEITRLNIPGTYNGVGDDVIAITGGTPDLLTADASSASHNFIVMGYGNISDLLINEIAPYSGTVILSSDTIVLEIIATGSWSLQVTTK